MLGLRVPQNEGYFLGGPYNEDSSIPPILGHCQLRDVKMWTWGFRDCGSGPRDEVVLMEDILHHPKVLGITVV